MSRYRPSSPVIPAKAGPRGGPETLSVNPWANRKYQFAAGAFVSLRFAPAWFMVCRYSCDMKFTFILPVGFAVLFLQGCSTTPKWNDRQAYECRIGGGNRLLDVLQALDAGGVEQARQVALLHANRMLIDLPSVTANAHLTQEDRMQGMAFAKAVLNYELIHKDELDGRSGADDGLKWLKQVLTEPEDVRRLAELEDCLARADYKIREDNRKLESAKEAQTTQSDAEISRKVVGTWIVDVQLPTYSAKGTETFAADGSYVAKATVVQYGKQREEKFEGKWQVKDGFLMATGFMHDKIIHVDDNELVSLEGWELINEKAKQVMPPGAGRLTLRASMPCSVQHRLAVSVPSRMRDGQPLSSAVAEFWTLGVISIMNSPEPLETPIMKGRRPLILTFFCILGILSVIANLWRVCFGPPSLFGSWFLPFLTVSAIITAVAMVGIWFIRVAGQFTLTLGIASSPRLY